MGDTISGRRAVMGGRYGSRYGFRYAWRYNGKLGFWKGIVDMGGDRLLDRGFQAWLEICLPKVLEVIVGNGHAIRLLGRACRLPCRQDWRSHVDIQPP